MGSAEDESAAMEGGEETKKGMKEKAGRTK